MGSTKIEVRPLSSFADVPEDIVNAAAGIVLKDDHLNPHLGLLVKAFRRVNTGVSQVKLAKGIVGDRELGVTTTHAQIAMLEQGNSVNGAQPVTLELLSLASGISQEALAEMNSLDIANRAPAPATDGGEGDGSEPEATPKAKSTTKRHSSTKPAETPATENTPAPVSL